MLWDENKSGAVTMTGLGVVNIPPPSQYLNIPALLSDLGSHPQPRIYSPLSSGDIMELYEFSQNHPRSAQTQSPLWNLLGRDNRSFSGGKYLF